MPIPDLSDRRFVEEHERYVEIYKITNLNTKKCYVGQAVSHILNHKKYRRYGMEKRFKCHVSEAFSKKKNQCHYLNRSIKKHGPESFTVELIERCWIEDADDRESHYILTLDTMYPNGYNLKLGTATTRLSEQGRKRVSRGVHRYYKAKKLERFKDIEIPADAEIDKYIRPLNREGEHFGWYVLIKRKKADFGGVHISLEESREMAREFLLTLQERTLAKHLDAGTSLESSGTTSS